MVSAKVTPATKGVSIAPTCSTYNSRNGRTLRLQYLVYDCQIADNEDVKSDETHAKSCRKLLGKQNNPNAIMMVFLRPSLF
jgi:hypothetical protein